MAGPHLVLCSWERNLPPEKKILTKNIVCQMLLPTCFWTYWLVQGALSSLSSTTLFAFQGHSLKPGLISVMDTYFLLQLRLPSVSVTLKHFGGIHSPGDWIIFFGWEVLLWSTYYFFSSKLDLVHLRMTCKQASNLPTFECLYYTVCMITYTPLSPIVLLSTTVDNLCRVFCYWVVV